MEVQFHQLVGKHFRKPDSVLLLETVPAGLTVDGIVVRSFRDVDDNCPTLMRKSERRRGQVPGFWITDATNETNETLCVLRYVNAGR